MNYDADSVAELLENLGDGAGEIIYTQHFLDGIGRRCISEELVEEFLVYKSPAEVREVAGFKDRFELKYEWCECCGLIVTVDLFNRRDVFLISAVPVVFGDDLGFRDELVEFEGVYDVAYDLLNVDLTSSFRYAQTVDMGCGVYIDFDVCFKPVGIEIVSASRKFDLRVSAFSSAKLTGTVEITDDVISIEIEPSFQAKRLNFKCLQMEATNSYGIKPSKFGFEFMVETD